RSSSRRCNGAASALRARTNPPRSVEPRAAIARAARRSAGARSGGVNASQALNKLQVGRALLGTRIITPVRPDKVARILVSLSRWGPTPAAAYAGGAIQFPNRVAIIDERGAVTFGEVQRRTNALASELSRRGVSEGDGVAIICRNHRGFVEATVACAKLGASALYLNTSCAGPRRPGVGKRQHPVAPV